jgi:hypothetical protein
VLVAVLAIATIVLVVLALQSVRPSPADVTQSPAPSFTFGGASPSASPTTSPAPTPSLTPSSTPETSAASFGAAERFFAIGSDGWWRATAGVCGGETPLLEHSTDGGRTWEDVTPNYRGIAQIASLDAFAGSEAEMVAGMGAACEVQALRTFTQGEFWQPYPEVLAVARYPQLADPASIVLPRGAVQAPCAEPASFRAVGDVVALVCEGTVSVLTDGEWQALPATDAVALTIDDGTLVAAARTADCEGVALSRWSGDGFATSTPLGCAAGVDAAAPLAVAATADSAWVWTDDRLVTAGR